MAKRRKTISLILCCAIIFAFLFSACFIAAEADHDCCGADCPICFAIDFCIQTLETVGALFLPVFTCIAAFAVLTVVFLAVKTLFPSLYTLILLKVKLSD